MMFRASFFALLAISTFPLSAQSELVARPPGRSLQVDPHTGDDKNDGMARPVKTIKRAIKMAEPGDTVHLAPVLYYEYADLSLKHGEPGRPITLDGHGAVLDGSEPVLAKDWESMGDGVYRKHHLMRNMDAAVLMRFFLIWNGRANHMDRTSKGTSKPFKKPADLAAGEWTYTSEDDTVYVKIDPGQTLDEAKIRYPLRSAGVIESGSCSNLVVRNVITTHVYNDGYNIHGKTRNCRFENIAAIDCGDDGFSAHDDCQCETDGFVSIGNSTGLTDTGISITRFKNVYMRGNLGHDVFFIGENIHSIENGLIESGAQHALSVGVSGSQNLDGATCPVELKNVLFHRVGPTQEGRVSRGGVLTATRCSFIGMNVKPSYGGQMTLNQCVVSEVAPQISDASLEGADAHGLRSLAGKAEAVVKQWEKLEGVASYSADPSGSNQKHQSAASRAPLAHPH